MSNNVTYDGSRIFCTRCETNAQTRARKKFGLHDLIFCSDCHTPLQTRKDFCERISFQIQYMIEDGATEDGISEEEIHQKACDDIKKHLIRESDVFCEHSKDVILHLTAHLFYRESGMTFIFVVTLANSNIELTFKNTPVGVISEKIFAVL